MIARTSCGLELSKYQDQYIFDRYVYISALAAAYTYTHNFLQQIKVYVYIYAIIASNINVYI
jgi:hypothetical protein